MRSLIGVLALLICASPATADIIHVDIDATGLNNGRNWTDAYTDLELAARRARAGDELWVAEGTYLPTSTADPTDSFHLISGVEWYGGFDGTETLRAERDWELHTTILSGDLGLVPGGPDRVDYIVTAVEADSTSCIDGFLVQDGSHGMLIELGNPRILNTTFARNVPDGGGSGAGVEIPRLSGASFTNVVFRDNTAGAGFGGAVAAPAGHPVFDGALFENNRATHAGGAFWGEGQFTDVVFSSNSADDAGGAVSGNGKFTRVEFSNNSSLYGAGGMNGRGEFTDVQFIRNRGDLGGGHTSMGGALMGGGTLTNVLFERNTHGTGGGAMWDRPGGSTLVNVVFRGNAANYDFGGGALWIGAEPYATVTVAGLVTMINCSFQGNVCGEGVPGTGEYGGGTIHTRGGNLLISNTILWGNTGGLEIVREDAVSMIDHSLIDGCGGSGAGWVWFLGTDFGGNLDADPRFVASDDLHLDIDSPAINAGDQTKLPLEVTTDLDGNPRVLHGEVDMGAFEAPRALSADAPLPARPHFFAAPNPFNPVTSLHFTVERPGPVKITVYELSGRRLVTLVSRDYDAGEHHVDWDGTDRTGRRVASGVYLGRFEMHGRVHTTRITMVK